MIWRSYAQFSSESTQGMYYFTTVRVTKAILLPPFWDITRKRYRWIVMKVDGGGEGGGGGLSSTVKN